MCILYDMRYHVVFIAENHSQAGVDTAWGGRELQGISHLGWRRSHKREGCVPSPALFGVGGGDHKVTQEGGGLPSPALCDGLLYTPDYSFFSMPLS